MLGLDKLNGKAKRKTWLSFTFGTANTAVGLWSGEHEFQLMGYTAISPLSSHERKKMTQ